MSAPEPAPLATALPVAAVLPDLIAAMETRHAVLVAEPGAGKTTLAPPALLGAPWLDGRIILLERRRVVARAAAARIAHILGDDVGGTVGTRMRMDVRVSARTRIEVVTEGVFARQALDDPELAGVGAVVFDEYHERSLDADFGLALALDIARSLRPDLRLLAMSATIDAEAVAALMDGAAVLRSPGRAYPITIRHRPAGPREPIWRAVASAVREGEGSTLAFVPGRAEVDRTLDALGDLGEGVEALPLHGGLDARAQDRAVRPAAPGMRKIVVATPIAESSLTIEGIKRVVDSGLVREPVFDIGTGITRLETRRASLASVDQRAGRAGRTGPGEAVRLWAEGATRALAAHAPPEVLRTDLSGLVLDCLDWGVRPDALDWLDAPPDPALVAAHALLKRLGALEGEPSTITALGRAVRRLPLPPRLASAVMLAGPSRERSLAARWALLASERGLGGDGVDLAQRDRVWRNTRGERAHAAKNIAARWAELADRAANDLPALSPHSATVAFARAHPDRIARARGPARPDGRRAYLLSSGRGAFLDASDPLASEDWLIALDMTGQAREQRIVAALSVSQGEVEEALVEEIKERDELRFDGGKPEARQVRALGAIVLDERRVPRSQVDDDALARGFATAIRERGIDRLPWGERSDGLRQRLTWVHARVGDPWPDMSDEALADALEEWLVPQLPGASSLDAITDRVLHDGLLGRVPWDRRAELDRLAPERFAVPTGTMVRLQYPVDGLPPRLAVRVQELFGLDRHPEAAGVPLLLDLLSPARRPIQTTADLPGFWRGSWADVRKEMRARYPRHPWPERPWEARPTTRVKPRGT